ncbi:MAG: ATP-binding protein [Thermovirgaceae bacterium]|jgi:signal transduction histidine kinase|nr:ATP-binding protein [Synergistales bacterium]MDI9393518.1 ATP-binding protein [Synergistota bacterium]MDY0179580.1 ATP-binding protein [Synergistaceae bacterium]HRW87731.1 ATP-binding protein [Thermovirgaceae bacterium]MDD3133324.1 ATP-binding protein [Synergistales bacterium]
MLQDLSQYILDIAENSLKARASSVEIEVNEDTRENVLRLRVSDNGVGLDSEQLSMVENPFFTTRTERRVGLGIPFLRQAADTCDGSFGIRSAKGRGTVIEASFRRDCIDCPPLGDIPATIMTLMVGWPERSFLFRFRFNDDIFETGTEELLQILEDRELLASAEVALWISRYMEQGIYNLRTGGNEGFEEDYQP